MINMKGRGAVRLRKTLCCLLAGALLSVPLLTGCGSGNKETSAVSESSAETSKDSSVIVSDVTSDVSDGGSKASSDISDVSGNKSTIKPAMWKVEDDSGHYCYMFGTVHAADDSADIMPDYFENAYLDSDAIGVEADITYILENPLSVSDLYKYLIYMDGTKIQDHISEETYNAVSEVMKNNSSAYIEHMYDMFKPVAWSSVFEGEALKKCGLDTEKGIDIRAIKRAKSDGKEVIELESVEYQAQMFERLSDRLGELLLLPYTTQEGFDQQVENIGKLYDDWKNGRPVEENVDESQLEQLDAETREAYEYYMDEMLRKRNPAMADKISGYLNEGKKVLVMVGSAHFYGDDGLVKLMESKGCKVTSIAS